MHRSDLAPLRILGSPPPTAGAAGADGPDPALDLLVDRAVIHDVIMRYAAAVDRRDWAVLESCFLDDVDTSRWGGSTGQGRADLIEFIKGVAAFHTTMHMMGNQFIEVDGDRASLDNYAMLTHHYLRHGEPAEMNMSGNRYVEFLARAPGGWIITRRGGDPVWAPTGVKGVSSDVALVSALRDRAEIHDLLMQYALGIDLRDYERMAGCFAEDFRARYGNVELTDHKALIDFVRGVEHFQSTTHFLSRPWIELSGSRAEAVTYAMISHRTEGGGPRMDDRRADLP